MTIRTYKDVTFPFDTEFVDGLGKVRLLAAVVNDYAAHIIGYSCYGDPLTSCSQVLEWDENGIFGGGGYPTMNLVPPPGVVADRQAALEGEIVEIRHRLNSNPDAPEAWRSRDERQLAALERQLAKLSAPHIWGTLNGQPVRETAA